LQDVFSFNPSASVPPSDSAQLPRFADGTSLCVQPSAVCQDDRPTSAGNESAGNESAGASRPAWKCIIDVTFILLSMPIWLPVLICMTLWVKIASPGPIFFRQERVGYRGRRFMILKLRTMKVNAETVSHERHFEQLVQADCPMTKLDVAGDTRIIPGGRVLRAIGLDELPQLFNVLRGEMSLVGPRPCTPHEFRCYKPWQQERVNAVPGLTGYWQVNGKNKTTFSEMIEMDIQYVRRMSLWLDLAIILKTFPAIIAQLLESRIPVRIWRGRTKPVT
jgi:lipopolysaccharide/colanic/teichoic acid biosynthesis glycosyltransferase